MGRGSISSPSDKNITFGENSNAPAYSYYQFDKPFTKNLHTAIWTELWEVTEMHIAQR